MVLPRLSPIVVNVPEPAKKELVTAIVVVLSVAAQAQAAQKPWVQYWWVLKLLMLRLPAIPAGHGSERAAAAGHAASCRATARSARRNRSRNAPRRYRPACGRRAVQARASRAGAAVRPSLGPAAARS